LAVPYPLEFSVPSKYPFEKGFETICSKTIEKERAGTKLMKPQGGRARHRGVHVEEQVDMC